jgi:hypothetical protein
MSAICNFNPDELGICKPYNNEAGYLSYKFKWYVPSRKMSLPSSLSNQNIDAIGPEIKTNELKMCVS